MKEGIKNFYDLDTWKKAHDLVLDVYKVTDNFPKEEKYGLTAQLRRASSSITANIAEGFARYHFKDKIRFYYQARSSVAETQNFFLLSKDLEFAESEICKSLIEKGDEVRKLINGLIKTTEKARYNTH